MVRGNVSVVFEILLNSLHAPTFFTLFELLLPLVLIPDAGISHVIYVWVCVEVTLPYGGGK